MVNLGLHPTSPEQAKELPAVLVSADQLHHPNLRMVVLVPGTTTIRDLPIHVRVDPDPDNGLSAVTAFQVEQVRAVSVARMVSRLGHLDAVSRHALDDALRMALDLH